jgi:hypothetical protein
MSAETVNLVNTFKESVVISIDLTFLYSKFHFFDTEVENCLILGHAETYTNYRVS